MFEPKPFASLGPTLLARKGGAKPAMRPQLSPLLSGAQAAHALEADHEALEDLGWNDMGDADEEAHDADVIPFGLTPMGLTDEDDEEEEEYESDNSYAPDAPIAAAAEETEYGEPEYEEPEYEEPEYGEPFLASEPVPAPRAPAEPEVLRQQHAISASLREDARPARRRNAIDDGRRAAFTLRLDGDRHLKLRLASTIKNRSAQQLVTQALDKFLADIPEIEALAAQVSRN